MSVAVGGGLESLRLRVAGELERRLFEHVGRLDWDAARLARHRRERLRILLAHAIERSPFHARRLGGLDVDSFEPEDLRRLPVMTKAQMMAGFDDVVTDRRLGRRVVEEHLARSTEEPSLLLDDYVCLASGGGSGRRGVFVQTISEYAGFAASLMRRPVSRAAESGGLPPEGLVIGLVAAASPVHSTGFGAAMAARGPVRLLAAPATLPLDELVERLNAISPPALMGYPSKLADLAREQRAGRLRIAPRTVTATSEMLTAADRAAIGAAFGAPVLDLFASTEGLVGHSEPDEPLITFATDMCIVELVDADGRPARPGEASAKVLVTNLHNLTQPLIRYELGDRFVGQRSAANGHLRAAVDGRADDILRYAGAAVHPLVIRTALVGFAAAREYQVHQTPRGIDVAVVADGPLDEAALADSLRARLGAAGLADPSVAVRTVDSLARNPQTGKINRFVALGAR